MNQNITTKYLVVPVVLACAATTSAALTLGSVQGAVLLGQPLSLTVGIQAEADEVAADLCFDADVYYGDLRQESSRISVVPLRQGGGVPNAVRIRVTSPVDEPVVTVYLRSSCVPRTSRKYVLLSDLARELMSTMPGALSARSAQPLPHAVPGELSAPALFAANPVASPPSVKSSVKTWAPGSPLHPVVDTLRANAMLKHSGGAKASLKLSILDLLDIKAPSLKLSNELSNPPSEDPQKREVAASLWRSLNMSSQDLLQESARQKALTDDLKTFRDLSGKNERDLQDLSGRLSKAESERYFNPLVYALAGLLLIVGGALVALIIKLRRGGREDAPWWRIDSEKHPDARDGTPASQQDPSIGNFSSQPSESISSVSLHPSQPASISRDVRDACLDIDLDFDTSEPAAPVLEVPHPVQRKELAATNGSHGVAVPGAHRDLSHSMHASLNAINTQEMLDVRQQADFFMTLGQHEEAIGLLEGSIQESEASNPLVYLDLLKVLHTLSRKPAFDHYRSEFNSIFTGRVPAYVMFGQPGNSLDAYPQICVEISEVWSTDSVVEFLEQCMVRRSEDAPELYFDLDAFRDLLLLHAVASRFRLNSISDSGLMPFSAVKIATTEEHSAAVSEVTPKGLSEMAIPVVPVEQAASELAVDLDLSSDNNLIDFDASGLTVNLSRSEKLV